MLGSCRVQGMIDRYKYETEWEENHMVGVHVRRGDLTIYGKNVRVESSCLHVPKRLSLHTGTHPCLQSRLTPILLVQNNHNKITTLIPIESYIQAMQKQKELAAGVKRVRFFLATDDAQAEAEIKAAFKPGELSTPSVLAHSFPIFCSSVCEHGYLDRSRHWQI